MTLPAWWPECPAPAGVTVMDATLSVRVLMSELASLVNTGRLLVALDCETTGTALEQDRVIELALVIAAAAPPFGPTPLARACTALVNPGRPIPPEATAVHGITDAMVAEATLFAPLVPWLLRILGAADLVGYNLRGFDLRLLEAEVGRVGARLPECLVFDPCEIFKKREERTLGAAMRFYANEEHEEGAHRALADAVAAARVLEGQLLRYPDLPHDGVALSDYCARRDPNAIDRDGKIVWRDGEAVLGFGKHQGRSLRVLAANADGQGFLRWMLAKDFAPDTKRIVSEVLAGRFPQRKAK